MLEGRVFVPEHEMLGRVVELYLSHKRYRSYPMSFIWNAVFPAVKNERFLAWWGQDLAGNRQLLGFCAYAALTEAEVSSNEFRGSEVYARPITDSLHFTLFVYADGASGVGSFVRHVQRTLTSLHPTVPKATAIKVYSSGERRPAAWPRKGET